MDDRLKDEDVQRFIDDVVALCKIYRMQPIVHIDYLEDDGDEPETSIMVVPLDFDQEPRIAREFTY